jgi:hypothetical protein
LISHKSVVYLITSPLSKRDYDRFGIKCWLDRGWKVKVFDFTKFLKPEFWDYVDGTKLSIGFKGLNIFEDEISALSSIQQLKAGAFFIDRISWSSTENKIRLAAMKKGVIINLNLTSIPMSSQSTYFKLLNNIKKFLKHHIHAHRLIIKKFREFYLSAPNYFVAGGTKSIRKFSKSSTSIIKAHNYDYDYFLMDDSSKLEQVVDKVVFLDGDEAYHSDFINLGIKPYVTAERYYPTMDDGLSKIAEALNCELKIAAHPRSDYDKKIIKYSFPTLKDQTYELIKQSIVVVSHGSTCLQWAIFMRKPIILVTTDEMNKSIFRHTTEAFAFALGKDVVNLNRIPKKYDWKSQLFINEKKYQNYIETYAKQSGSPEKPIWEIVIDRMETDFFNAEDLQKQIN